MAEAFDPYHRWLGIKPKDQPPHHYRLLAIDLFEDDPVVIENAADQRMAHLRTVATGKYGKLAQGLLNDIAAAKVCLLNTEKKAAYDKVLRSQGVGASMAEKIPQTPRPHPLPAASQPMGPPAPELPPLDAVQSDPWSDLPPENATVLGPHFRNPSPRALFVASWNSSLIFERIVLIPLEGEDAVALPMENGSSEQTL